MRILIVHEALAGGGGVESYLGELIPALMSRGHDVAFLHYNSRRETGGASLARAGVPSASVADDGLDEGMTRMRAWKPDVCFSHNMRYLDVEDRLLAEWPVVKMMHGYFGTCISGQKSHAFPTVSPCARALGAACLGLYLPRRCGRLRPWTLAREFEWAGRQRALFGRYADLVVASRHMGAEYRQNGAPRVTVAPLFAGAASNEPRRAPAGPVVLFAGRMTAIKGAPTIVRAVAAANRALASPLRLVLAGEGPRMDRLRALAATLRVDVTFTGWVGRSALRDLIRSSTLVAVPSLWPEPFGLIGLEAACEGVPAVGFDVGGIPEWLRDGVNGRLVRERGSASAFGRTLADVVQDVSGLRRLEMGALAAARSFTKDAHLDILERVFDRARSGVPSPPAGAARQSRQE